MIGVVKRGTVTTLRFVESLIKLSDGTRLLTGAAARVCINGTWGAGAGTLAVDETDQWRYTLHSTEAAAVTLEIAVDHADAIGPIGGGVLMLPPAVYEAFIVGSSDLQTISKNPTRCGMIT